MAESEGSFTIEDWNVVYEAGKRLCCDDIETTSNDDIMQDDASDEMAGEVSFVKSVVREKVEADLHWKE